MATVKFKRIANSSTINDYPVDDGTFWITGDGKSYIDYGQNRVSTNGTLDTEISDTSRNAVENSVIKEYIDIELNNLKTELSPKLLWSNPNPTSVFEPQTITLSSNDYDTLIFILKRQKDDNTLIPPLMLPKGMSGVGLSQALNGENRRRGFTYIDDTHFTCTNGATPSGTADNETVIPLYVIGYKTGLFE